MGEAPYGVNQRILIIALPVESERKMEISDFLSILLTLFGALANLCRQIYIFCRTNAVDFCYFFERFRGNLGLNVDYH